MATIEAKICKIEDVIIHDNADKLEIALVDGWECIVPKAKLFCKGDLVLYIPIDAAIPDELAIKIGVKSYLGKGNRVKAAKLRGRPSYGIIVDCEDLDLKTILGKDYAAQLGITKWEPGEPPPVKPTFWTRLNKIRRAIKKWFYKLFGKEGTREPQKKSEQVQHPLFPIYTKIEHLRKNKTALDGMLVRVTEKIHGTNSRVGVIRSEPNLAGIPCSWKQMWGSHHKYSPSDTIYKMPLELDWVKNLIDTLTLKYLQQTNIILFGEIYGKGVQKLDYGQQEKAYRIFDIMVGMKYLSPQEIEELNIPADKLVPILYTGVYDYDRITALAKGKTLAGANHIREGVVVQSYLGVLDSRGNRLIFKHASDDYLTGNYEPDEIAPDQELS